MKTRRTKILLKDENNSGNSILEDNEYNHPQQGQLPRKKLKKSSEFQPFQNFNDLDQIPFIPEVNVTLDEMKSSPLALLMKLQEKYQQFGAVKLVPPLAWSPPFSMKYAKVAMTTRIQPLHSLKLGKPFEEKKEAYSLEAFREMAEQFQRQYRFKFSPEGNSKSVQLENQYWQLVQGPPEQLEQKNPKKFKVTVQYAADLSVSKYGSGFPMSERGGNSDSIFSYSSNGWNLNNLYKCDESMLKVSDFRGEHIGGITVPWVYVGMQFATFCWHVEDCNIHSLNYNHLGADKVWYILPRSQSAKFARYAESKFGNRNMLSKITCMIHPLEVARQGIKIYKTYQSRGQYVCTLFGAYHCGFSTGFNVAEAVNFVVPRSLSQIKEGQGRASLFCYQWLVAENYERGMRNEVKKEYENLVGEELANLKFGVESLKIKRVQFVDQKVKYDRYICHECKKYVYLSFLSCQKCSHYSCFKHIKTCCQAPVFSMIIRPFNKQRGKAHSLVKHLLK